MMYTDRTSPKNEPPAIESKDEPILVPTPI